MEHPSDELFVAASCPDEQCVFEIVDSDGHAYVLQAHSPQFSMAALDESLVFDLGPHMTIHGLGDEFHQYYTRIPEEA